MMPASEPPARATDFASAGSSRPRDRTHPGRRTPRLLRHDTHELAAIFAGGAVGTLGRAALAEGYQHAPTAWPWPTFVANLIAVALLGYFVTRLQERLPLSSYRRPLLGTGLCGGLSTFSTMQVELLAMLDAHAYLLALSYAAVSVLLGLAVMQVTSGLVRRVRAVS